MLLYFYACVIIIVTKAYPWDDLRLLESNQDKRGKGPLSARWTTLLLNKQDEVIKKKYHSCP